MRTVVLHVAAFDKWSRGHTVSFEEHVCGASAARPPKGGNVADRWHVRTVETASAHEREWVDAEQVEHIELLQSQIDTLQVEREWLKTELLVARSWVKELALWLDLAQARTGRDALPVTKPGELTEILSPSTLQQLCEGEKAPIAWGKVAAVAGHVLLPWAGLGVLAYVTYALAA